MYKAKLNNNIKAKLLSFCIMLPVVFALIFFGYFRVHYDIVMQVDNVKGEGICQTYGSKLDGRTTANQTIFYFGSKLKKATIKGSYYDVDTLSLVTSDVSEFDIISIDSYVKGIHTGHFGANDILPDGETVKGSKATLSSKNGILHVSVYDPDEGATVSITQPFIPLWFWVIYFSAIIIISILLAALLGKALNKYPTIKLPLLSAACIVVTLLAGCFFCGSLSYMLYNTFLLNCLFLFAAAMLLNAVTMPFAGTLFVMLFTTAWYIANYFVIALRGKPIMPADLKAVDTAEEVMGGYTFTPSWKMIAGVMIVLCYAALLIRVWIHNRPKEKQPIHKRLLQRGALILGALVLMTIGVNTDTFKSLNSFAWDTTLMRSFHEEGMVLTYLKSVYNSGVSKPEGYSSEKVQAYLKEYEPATETDTDTVQPTNIIMVMDEAFSDLRTVGLDEKIDVMPFIDSLHKNTVEGSLYVSVIGGGTCNTEFEALTGNTLAFLGAGAYPYAENVTDPLFSLADYFKSNGYITEAFHANHAKNWNRNMVYPLLGFDTFHSIEDYEKFGDITYLHGQPADISDYKYMESVDEKYKGKNRFLFGVTMQNHSPYERWLDVDKAESVAENGSDLYVDAQVYLSLIKASDDEVKQLVESYQNSDEPTMIIFFGDHQPGLPDTAFKEIYTDVHSNLDFYKSKFFIWTNYETVTKHDVAVSANYMPWLVLERGNFPMPPYVQMLKEVHEKYPIISSQGVMDADGNVYAGVAELEDDPLIKKYRYVQYANMFDEIDPAWFKVAGK